MNIDRPGSPSATTVAPTSKRHSTSIETKRSRLASERPPKKGVASKNAFRSGELTAIDLVYSRSQRRQAGQAGRDYYDKQLRGRVGLPIEQELADRRVFDHAPAQPALCLRSWGCACLM
jgi:hypothetical protein